VTPPEPYVTAAELDAIRKRHPHIEQDTLDHDQEDDHDDE
jgi:hypothetical protein